jgi:hypothetical protein
MAQSESSAIALSTQTLHVLIQVSQFYLWNAQLMAALDIPSISEQERRIVVRARRDL